MDHNAIELQEILNKIMQGIVSINTSALIFSHIYNYSLYVCVFVAVVITRPPEDTTACRGSEVTIACGHNSTTPFDTIWSINKSSFDSLANNPLYQLSNQTLIIFSINYTTTVQCAVHIREVSPPIILTSGTATVMVVGMYKYIIYVFMHNVG